MYDIHSHFLPGLDDGARTMEEAREMLEMAAAHGTKGIVATPHADTKYRFDPAAADALLDELRQSAPAGLTLYRGCDFHLMYDNVEDALRDPARYTINGGCYLLMELSEITIFGTTSSLWSRLEDVGMKIILTHPERNHLLRARPELVEEWVAEGRLMQVTAQSLSGFFGPKALEFSRQLLDRGLVHFIASDGHDTKGRLPHLDEAFAWIEANYSRRLAELLCVEHPLAVIESKPIDLTAFPPKVDRVAKKGFWRRVLGGGQDSSS